MSKRSSQPTLFGFAVTKKAFISKPETDYDRFVNKLWEQSHGMERRAFQKHANEQWQTKYKHNQSLLDDFMMEVSLLQYISCVLMMLKYCSD